MTQSSQELGRQVRLLRVMIAMPGDVEHEIEIVKDEILAWNAEHAEAESIVLMAKHWSTHSHPQLGDRAQAIINRQLTDQADVLIAIFWTRLGESTGVAESGTAEEIRRFYDARRPVKLYFSGRDVPMSLLRDKARKREYQRLEQFKTEVRGWGLYQTYPSETAFRDLFKRQIYQEVRDLKERGFQSLGVTEPAIPPELKILQRTLRQLSSDWVAERDSQPFGNFDKGKLIMGRLANAVSAHRANLIDDLPPESLQMLQEVITGGRSFTKFLVTYGGGDRFWGPGTDLITGVSENIDALVRRWGASVTL